WALGADVAVANSGGIRRSIDAGELRRGAIFEALPFENRVFVIDADAALLRRLLEHSVSIFYPTDPKQAGGQFLQLSGLRIRVARRKPVGQRVTAIEWQTKGRWRRLAQTDKLRVAVQDFIYLGGDGYGFLKVAPIRRKGRRLLRDIVLDYLRKHPTVSPRVEGRIRLD
ncbi:MAG: 5'-nucleotidase C-terminal domain-containing protein, partial [Myxococcales bacterium]|nr:5'-nucleotidase C-terminal domain-containing protein [Myxococcales bacterium]